jgi:hypothetical protein
VRDAKLISLGAKTLFARPYPKKNNFWWIEFGGNLDTVGDANEIQFELKKVAYGVWAYMKNHPDGRAKGYELDWIGSLPGKRESTRFVGPHILNQHDVTSGGHFEDVVAYGGWTLDDHHPDAVFRKDGPVSVQYAAPSPFGIPFDCLYSVNVPNLMFAGRDISCTHMALSSSRVMATCATLGQAVGTAAALLVKYGIDPAQLRRERIAELQDALLRYADGRGCDVVDVSYFDSDDSYAGASYEGLIGIFFGSSTMGVSAVLVPRKAANNN